MSHATNSPTELAQALAVRPGQTVIDVRTPAEFAEVHATPARSLPLAELSAAKLEAAGHTDPAAPVYLLCQSGGRAAAAAGTLAAAGFKSPVVVAGGTTAWVAAGLPVVRGAKKAVGLERQVRIAAGSLVLIGVALSKLVHPEFVWLAGFVGAGLVFAGITDFCGMGLMLARAPWNR